MPTVSRVCLIAGRCDRSKGSDQFEGCRTDLIVPKGNFGRTRVRLTQDPIFTS